MPAEIWFKGGSMAHAELINYPVDITKMWSTYVHNKDEDVSDQMFQGVCCVSVSQPTWSLQDTGSKNKYAIHAYTHGPVTGSGSSVVTPLLRSCLVL